MAEYNYQHSYNLLRSIERIVYKEGFDKFFKVDDYDFFEAYRYRMFADIKGWRKRNGVYSKETKIVRVRVFILNILGATISFLGIIQLILSFSGIYYGNDFPSVFGFYKCKHIGAFV